MWMRLEWVVCGDVANTLWWHQKWQFGSWKKWRKLNQNCKREYPEKLEINDWNAKWPWWFLANSRPRYYPFHASPTPPQTKSGRASKKIILKRGSGFQPINRRTWPISCGGSNQREPPVLPGSPSPSASADILFSPTSRAPEEQRQSRRSHSGGKLGASRKLVALGNISCPDWPSVVCRSPTMMYCFIGSNFSPFLYWNIVLEC